MKPVPFRLSLRRQAAAVAVIGLILWAGVRCLRGAENRLTVVNRSGRTVARLRVEVANSPSSFAWEGLPDGGSVSSPFEVGGDGHFAVSGRLDDGTALGGEFGYVTDGTYGARVRLVVTPGGAIEESP